MPHRLGHLVLKSLAFRVCKSQSRKVALVQWIQALPIDANPNMHPMKTISICPNGRQSFVWPTKIRVHQAMQSHWYTPYELKELKICTNGTLNIFRFFFFIFLLTWVTIDTIEQQNPPKNAVANMVVTDLANTVIIQDNENGSEITVKIRRRPYCRKNPPNKPPNNAPVHTNNNNKVNTINISYIH